MRRLLLSAVAAMATMLALSAPALAADLQRASIRNGQEFELSPFSFSALYSDDVTLAGASLVDQDGKAVAVPLGVVRRSKLVAFDLPVLPPHGYRLEWRVRGGPSGGESVHQVSFVIRGCVDPKLVRLTSGRP